MRPSAEGPDNTGEFADADDADGLALRAGDRFEPVDPLLATSARQYRLLVSFDTSAIPDDATVQSATLRLRRGGLTGSDPFTTHGDLVADIKSGAFGPSATLEASDWQAAATANAVVTLSAERACRNRSSRSGKNSSNDCSSVATAPSSAPSTGSARQRPSRIVGSASARSSRS